MPSNYGLFVRSLLEIAGREESRRREARRAAEGRERLRQAREREEEARMWQEIERKNEEERRRKEQEERHSKWLRQQEGEAFVMSLLYGFSLSNKKQEFDSSTSSLRLRCIANPNLEAAIVGSWRAIGYDVHNLSDIESVLKKLLTDSTKEELRERLKDNPYQWLSTYIDL